jgi:hypothetical protein
MNRRGVWRIGLGIAATFGVIALSLTLSWNTANAQGTDASGADTDAPQDLPWYDDGHAYFTERLQQTAIWFDSFFGDPRTEIRKDASANLTVVFDGFYSGVEDESENGIRFRGGADLPRFDKRLRLMVTSDADASVTGRDLAGIARDEVKDTDSAIGLGYFFRDKPNSKFGLGGGLSGGLSPEILLTARHIYTQPWTANTVSHVTSTLYWKSDDGPGVSLLLDYEWSPDTDTLWRYNVFGNYREEINGFEWSTQAKWARRLNDKTAINLRGGIRGETEPNDILIEGWLKFGYRRNLWRSWLFYELEPGLSWHEREAYEVEPTIALRLEVQFRQQ